MGGRPGLSPPVVRDVSPPNVVLGELWFPTAVREELGRSPPVGVEPEGMSMGTSEMEGLPVPTSGDSSSSRGSESGS